MELTSTALSPWATSAVGVRTVFASHLTIGSTVLGAGNVISANGYAGIFLDGSGSVSNVVQGNRIGTDMTSTIALSNSGPGIRLTNVSQSTIGGLTTSTRNLISGNQQAGVLIESQSIGNLVVGNFIGLDANGMARLGNASDGVLVEGGAKDNTIGGTVAGARNVISGNASNGIQIFSAGTDNNLVAGNFIGTDINGTSPIGNSSGVVVRLGAQGNTIGGVAEGARNIISGNDVFGVSIADDGTTGNLVLGNRIGTSVDGKEAVANGGAGVEISDGATGNSIGNTSAGNIISGNAGQGIYLHGSGTNGNHVQNNWIGINVDGNSSIPNGVYGVEISLGAVRIPLVARPSATLSRATDLMESTFAILARRGILSSETGSVWMPQGTAHWEIWTTAFGWTPQTTSSAVPASGMSSRRVDFPASRL